MNTAGNSPLGLTSNHRALETNSKNVLKVKSYTDHIDNDSQQTLSIFLQNYKICRLTSVRDIIIHSAQLVPH